MKLARSKGAAIAAGGCGTLATFGASCACAAGIARPRPRQVIARDQRVAHLRRLTNGAGHGRAPRRNCWVRPALPNSLAGSHRLPQALGMINGYGKRGLNGSAVVEAKMTQQAAVRHKRGGLYFEDFVPGEVVE